MTSSAEERTPAPRVSVLMPAYNAGRFIREAVASVLGQTLQDFEFWILNDGSTDGTGDILAELAKADRRVHVIDGGTNRGWPAGANRLLQMARGTYIARQDADDISEPDRLLQQWVWLDESPDRVMVGCDYRVIDADGRVVREDRRVVFERHLAWHALFFNALGAGGHVMIRRSALDAVGGFPCEDKVAQDYELLIRMLEAGRVGIVPECLYRYRMRHEESITMREAVAQQRVSHALSGRAIERVSGLQLQPEEPAILRAFWRWGGGSRRWTIADMRRVDAVLSACFECFLGGRGASGADALRREMASRWMTLSRGVCAATSPSIRAWALHRALRWSAAGAARAALPARAGESVLMEDVGESEVLVALREEVERLEQEHERLAVERQQRKRIARGRGWRPRWARLGAITRVLCRLAPTRRPPVLVLSFPRSGASWVGAVLGGAPDALFLHEPIGGTLLLRDGLTCLDAWHDSGRRCGCLELAERALRGEPVFHADVVRFPRQWTLASRTRRRPVVKEANPLLAGPLIAGFSPKIVLVVRHPAAVAESWRRLALALPPDGGGGPPRTASSDAEFWANIGTLQARIHREAEAALRAHPDHAVVHYEQLCADPVVEFQRLYRFCGLTWTAGIEAWVRRLSEAPDPDTRRRVPYGIRRASGRMAAAWRSEVTAADLAVLRAAYLDVNPPFYRDPADWE